MLSWAPAVKASSHVPDRGGRGGQHLLVTPVSATLEKTRATPGRPRSRALRAVLSAAARAADCWWVSGVQAEARTVLTEFLQHSAATAWGAPECLVSREG